MKAGWCLAVKIALKCSNGKYGLRTGKYESEVPK